MKLWSAEERVEELESAFELAKSEFESQQTSLENQLREMRESLDKEKDKSGDLQRANDEKDVMLTRLGMHYLTASNDCVTNSS